MTPWSRATTALALLGIDPVGLGGMILRARAGPARAAVLDAAKTLPGAPVPLHSAMTADDLEGGIDLSATLSGGTVVRQSGRLACTPATFLLGMAERADPALAARLALALDGGRDQILLALDEGADADERAPDVLADRLAFRVDLDGVALADIGALAPAQDFAALRQAMARIDLPSDLPEQLVILAVRLGIHSLRAPSFALRAARAHAALNGRDCVNDEDAAIAVDLVFSHRATQIPSEEAPQDPPPDPPENDDTGRDEDPQEDLQIPDEILLDAVRAALPANVLDKLGHGAGKGTGSGAGRKRIGNRRGRPLPARNARAASGARIDLMATIRAAIPWQTLRRQAQPGRTGPIILPSDLRARRYQDLSDRLLIFAVDASGSAALARLGEAKGAVELLLGQAYANRDHVALIAFRGTAAEVLLPPTRSLVQTKRRLAALPGGGGTPLAAGLKTAMELAASATSKGLTPSIVVLTDGRANVALDGSANRANAAIDAEKLARLIHASGTGSLVIDTGNRPAPSLRSLATTMGGAHLALPRADAQRLSAAINTHLKA